MPNVTYIEFNGTAHTVEVPVGTSLMRGAVDNNIAGLIFFTDAVAADQQPRTDTPTYTKRARYWRSGSGLIAGSANRSIRCGEATRCSTDPEPGHRARAMGGEYAE